MKTCFGSQNWQDVTIRAGDNQQGRLELYVQEPSETIRSGISSDENKINLHNISTMSTQLNAQWIVGFVDGEGCFNLDIHLKRDMQWGLQMQPEFTVVQNEVDIQILHALKDYFQCGSVSVNRTDHHGTRYHYRVKSVKDLHEKIVPFFENHSLKTKKNVEFRTFRTIVRLMHQGYHRNSLQNFLEIVELGERLRVRSRPKSNTRGNNVAALVEQLKSQLQQNGPTNQS